VSEPLPGLLGAAEAQCAAVEEAMIRLRAVMVPPVTAEGHEVHEALLDVRARLDSAEVLLREFRAERRRFRARAALRQQERDDAYDARLNELAKGAVRREFEGAQERMAQARAHVLELTRRARTADACKRLVEDCFDGLKDQFFGLLNIREELITRLRELQFETTMER
jgi:hypothetical protein